MKQVKFDLWTYKFIKGKIASHSDPIYLFDKDID